MLRDQEKDIERYVEDHLGPLQSYRGCNVVTGVDTVLVQVYYDKTAKELLAESPIYSATMNHLCNQVLNNTIKCIPLASIQRSRSIIYVYGTKEDILQ